ncbi:MAG: DEAD/DEAH box helicase [Acidobacteria bacterium]|nr:DEAD/DEAH box helicase [Acidobacteriota bacterium]
MIALRTVERFLSGAKGQALREGTRYAREARVGDLVGSESSISTVVRGGTGDFEVALWSEAGRLVHRCSCPSWRNPCKHQVAAALALHRSLIETDVSRSRRQSDGGRRAPLKVVPARPTASSAGHLDPDAPRRRALEERVTAARREKLELEFETPPFVRVGSASGFTYLVHMRGGAEGPHSCECPDFEANRLHTCKHVESVRRFLSRPPARAPRGHRLAAGRSRVYLHFGEVIEPRLFGVEKGARSIATPLPREVREAFDEAGHSLRPLARDPEDLLRWLSGFGEHVEADALDWLRLRVGRRPILPSGDFARLLPQLELNPYPYQWTGAKFLATTGRALLADEMGLGKTVQAILAAAALRKAAKPVLHVTIVCPASLRGGWQDEVRKWLKEDSVPLEGPAASRAGTIASRPSWLVTHYEQVWRDLPHHQAHPPDLLIIDEAQRAKGLRTRTARVLKAIGARHVFALTGTPLENRIEDAYAIAQLIDQRLLPPLWQIDRDHFVRDDEGHRVLLYRKLDVLRARLAPAFLRRRKEDVSLELPERIRSLVFVPMHPAVEATYEEVMAQVAKIAHKKPLLPPDLERMQRLLTIARRCCDGPHMLKSPGKGGGPAPKLAELEALLQDLCLGEKRKTVVFSEWTDMTARVEESCGKLRLPAFHLHGGVAVGRRPALIRAFSNHSGPAAFISTDAGGVGLNLQAADAVINLDLPWNPSRLEQRIARVHRIGSKRAVQVVVLVTKNSIEERMLHLHETKKNILENVWSRDGAETIAAPGGSGAFREMVDGLLSKREPSPIARTVARAERPRPSSPPPELNGDGWTRPAPGRVVDPAALARAIASVAPTLAEEHRRSLATVFRALAEALEVDGG